MLGLWETGEGELAFFLREPDWLRERVVSTARTVRVGKQVSSAELYSHALVVCGVSGNMAKP
jgi:hypothetical protein